MRNAVERAETGMHRRTGCGVGGIEAVTDTRAPDAKPLQGFKCLANLRKQQGSLTNVTPSPCATCSHSAMRPFCRSKGFSLSQSRFLCAARAGRGPVSLTLYTKWMTTRRNAAATTPTAATTESRAYVRTNSSRCYKAEEDGDSGHTDARIGGASE